MTTSTLEREGGIAKLQEANNLIKNAIEASKGTFTVKMEVWYTNFVSVYCSQEFTLKPQLPAILLLFKAAKFKLNLYTIFFVYTCSMYNAKKSWLCDSLFTVVSGCVRNVYHSKNRVFLQHFEGLMILAEILEIERIAFGANHIFVMIMYKD